MVDYGIRMFKPAVKWRLFLMSESCCWPPQEFFLPKTCLIINWICYDKVSSGISKGEVFLYATTSRLTFWCNHLPQSLKPGFNCPSLRLWKGDPVNWNVSQVLVAYIKPREHSRKKKAIASCRGYVEVHRGNCCLYLNISCEYIKSWICFLDIRNQYRWFERCDFFLITLFSIHVPSHL